LGYGLSHRLNPKILQNTFAWLTVLVSLSMLARALDLVSK
jgi:uncharacterized membrane protein YfcA